MGWELIINMCIYLLTNSAHFISVSKSFDTTSYWHDFQILPHLQSENEWPRVRDKLQVEPAINNQRCPCHAPLINPNMIEQNV